MSYRIDPRRPLTLDIRRIAGEEVERALGDLSAAGERPDEAFHECRKRLKSLRAVIRLVRSGDEAFARRENERYRDVAARLATPREAAALIETVDRLAAEFPDKAAGGALDAVREKLMARRTGVLGEGLPVAFDAGESCRTGLRALGTLALPDQPERAADILADGVLMTMRRAREALKRSSARGEPVDFHDLRKAVKAHAKHVTLLKPFWPSHVKERIKSLDELGQGLGDLHDIFVLRALIRDKGKPLGNRAATRLLDKLAKRSGRRLCKTCLASASELFRDKPRRIAGKVARNFRRASTEPQLKAAA